MCLSCNWILYLYLQYRKISDCQVGIPLFQVKHQIWTDLVVWTGVDSKLKTENIKYLNTVNSQLLLLILHRLPRQYWAGRVKSSLCLNTESLTTDYLYLLRHIASTNGSDDVISTIETQIWWSCLTSKWQLSVLIAASDLSSLLLCHSLKRLTASRQDSDRDTSHITHRTSHHRIRWTFRSQTENIVRTRFLSRGILQISNWANFLCLS